MWFVGISGYPTITPQESIWDHGLAGKGGEFLVMESIRCIFPIEDGGMDVFGATSHLLVDPRGVFCCYSNHGFLQGFLGRILGCKDFNQRSGTFEFYFFFEFLRARISTKKSKLWTQKIKVLQMMIGLDDSMINDGWNDSEIQRGAGVGGFSDRVTSNKCWLIRAI